MDAAALHGIAGQVVRTLDPHTEADPAGVLLTFLSSFGAMLDRPHALADGSRHPARLFGLLVGKTSGGRKGTAQAQVSRLLARADSYFFEECVFGGLASGEGLIAALADNDVNDKRALIFEPEFARVLKAASRDGSTLSAILRDAWDRNHLRVLTRKDPLKVDGAHVSVIAHITLAELRRYLTETEVASGLGNRFLVALVRRSKRLPRGGDLRDEVLDGLAQRIAATVKKASTIDTLARTSDAEILWESIYNAVDDELDGLYGAITARAEAQMLRLSVTYALLDGSSEINVDHVAAAEAVWAYCERSAALIFGGTVGDRIADRLLEALLNAGPTGLTAEEQHRVFNRHESADRLALARAALEDRGLVVTTRQETGGRPRVVTIARSEESEFCEVSSNGRSSSRDSTRTWTVPNER